MSHPGNDGLHPRPAPDLVLDEGLELETLAGRWRVVPAPGHSPTQVMLFDDRSRMLLSADLVLAPAIPYAEHDYTPDPWAEHVASLERARALARPCSCRGTERPTRMPPRGSRKPSLPRLPPNERVHELIATTPRSAWEVVDEILGPDAPFYPRQAGLSGATCLLEHLVRRGSAAAVRRERRRAPVRAVI